MKIYPSPKLAEQQNNLLKCSTFSPFRYLNPKYILVKRKMSKTLKSVSWKEAGLRKQEGYFF